MLEYPILVARFVIHFFHQKGYEFYSTIVNSGYKSWIEKEYKEDGVVHTIQHSAQAPVSRHQYKKIPKPKVTDWKYTGYANEYLLLKQHSAYILKLKVSHHPGYYDDGERYIPEMEIYSVVPPNSILDKVDPEGAGHISLYLDYNYRTYSNSDDPLLLELYKILQVEKGN